MHAPMCTHEYKSSTNHTRNANIATFPPFSFSSSTKPIIFFLFVMSNPPSEQFPVDRVYVALAFDMISLWLRDFIHAEPEARKAIAHLNSASHYILSKLDPTKLAGEQETLLDSNNFPIITQELFRNTSEIGGVGYSACKGWISPELLAIHNMASSPNAPPSSPMKELLPADKAKHHARSQSDTSWSPSQRWGQPLPTTSPNILSNPLRSPVPPISSTLTSALLSKLASISDIQKTTSNDYEHAQYVNVPTEKERDALVPTILLEPPSRSQTLDVSPVGPLDYVNNRSPITICSASFGLDDGSYTEELGNSSGLDYEPQISLSVQRDDIKRQSSTEPRNRSVSRGRTQQRGGIDNRNTAIPAKPSLSPTPSPASQRTSPSPSRSVASTHTRASSDAAVQVDRPKAMRSYKSDVNLRGPSSPTLSPVSQRAPSSSSHSIASTHARPPWNASVNPNSPRIVRSGHSTGDRRKSISKSPTPHAVGLPNDVLPTTPANTSSKPVRNGTGNRALPSAELSNGQEDRRTAPVPTQDTEELFQITRERSRDNSSERPLVHTNMSPHHDERPHSSFTTTKSCDREGSASSISPKPFDGAKPTAPVPDPSQSHSADSLNLPSPHSKPAKSGCGCRDKCCNAQCAEGGHSPRTLQFLVQTHVKVTFDPDDELSASQASSDSDYYSTAETQSSGRSFMADISSKRRKQRGGTVVSTEISPSRSRSRSPAEDYVCPTSRMELLGRDGIDYNLENIVSMRQNGREARDQ